MYVDLILLKELEAQYKCKVWVAQNGDLYPVKLMTTVHIQRAVAMLQRASRDISDATDFYLHPFWGPRGEMAQEAAEYEMNKAWDHWDNIEKWIACFTQELESRGERVPPRPARRVLPEVEVVEVTELGVIARIKKED